MKGNRKKLIYILSGLSAGLIAFSAAQLLASTQAAGSLSLSLLQGACAGLIFGFSFGLADGILYRELRSGLITAAISAVIGGVTAAAAQMLSAQLMLISAAALNLGGRDAVSVLLPLWRAAGWMLMGAAIGACDGIRQKAPRRIAAGVLGGLAGGLLGRSLL